MRQIYIGILKIYSTNIKKKILDKTKATLNFFFVKKLYLDGRHSKNSQKHDFRINKNI